MSRITHTEYVCDRCGKTVPVEEGDAPPDSWYGIQETHNDTGGCYDLCQSCGAQAIDFIDPPLPHKRSVQPTGNGKRK